MTGDLEGARIFVTGAGGFIGARIVQMLSRIECTVIRQSGAVLPAVAGSKARIENVTGDIRNRNTIAEAIRGADVIMHLAAQTSARIAESDPAADRLVNVVPLEIIANSAQQSGATLVFASTSTIFGMPATLPVNESYPDMPSTVYDRHKLEAETQVRTHGDGASLRLTNVYGPGQNAAASDRGVLNSTIAKAFRGEAITVFGSGEAVRDYLYIDDAARAFLAAAINGRRLAGNSFVVGSGTGTSLRDAFALVAERAGEHRHSRVHVSYTEPSTPLLQIDNRNFVADSSAFRDATGWFASCDLQTGIDRTIATLARNAES